MISDDQASILFSRSSTDPPIVTKVSPDSTSSISPEKKDINEENPSLPYLSQPHETNELLYLHGTPYVCQIPVIAPSPHNETSEREARAAERQELARATDRGWELLKGLEDNCLYFVSGWWSYRFCYNSEVTQFHHLTLQPGKQEPPKRDPTTKQFILGRVDLNEEHGWEHSNRKSNSQIDVHHGKQAHRLEIQLKGGSRYLVQKMERGTICDLTGKPRRVEVQFHCSPSLTDRIGYIKEVATCSYMMIVYTPRLCSDVAFLPPKESKSHTITCRAVVPEEKLKDIIERQATEINSKDNPEEAGIINSVDGNDILPLTVGGITIGGGKWINSEGQRMSIPEIFGEEVLDQKEKAVEIIARAKNKADGGQIEVATDADLKKLDLNPDMIEALLIEVQKVAKEKGWKIKIVDEPGQSREILGIVDGEDKNSEDIDDETEQEFLKDEL